jgi:hypothetical protein
VGCGNKIEVQRRAGLRMQNGSFLLTGQPTMSGAEPLFAKEKASAHADAYFET